MKDSYIGILFICVISLPLSIFLWISNMTISSVYRTQEYEESTSASPTRFLYSVLLPLIMMYVGLHRRSVNLSGGILGVIMAFFLCLANQAFFVNLVVFFFTSSWATKFRSSFKRKFDRNYRGGEGQRNWMQVLANGGVATHLTILYLIDCGISDRVVNFLNDYKASYLIIAIMSAFACSNGDTWASELGSVLSKSNPVLVTTFCRVPRGTNGGVTFIGLLMSFLGGLIIGLSHYLTIRFISSERVLLNNPPQWPIILCGGFAGFFGSLIDSILGATVQYSGMDTEGRVCDDPRYSYIHISGFRIINNHSVNLLSTIMTSALMSTLAVKYWPY